MSDGETQDQTQETPKKVGRRMTRVASLERRAACVALYREGLTMHQIAERIGISRQAVHLHLKMANEPRRPRGGNTHGGSRHT